MVLSPFFAILIFSPILIALIIILKLTGEGEVFFLQPRVGKNNNFFNLIKFSTMLKNSPNEGSGEITLLRDPRILPIGHFLRKYNLNELPQLFNILIGDMSLIGPRPQTKRCFDAFPQNIKKDIIKIKPGLSGIGSIVFSQEETFLSNIDNYNDIYDKIIMPYKGELELWYIKNKNIKNCILLIFLTVWIILIPKSKILWNVFQTLPKPNEELSTYLQL